MHKALADFPKTLLLKGRVCKECNQYFGNGIDLNINRGSYEAVERFRTGLKPLEDFSDFIGSHIEFKAVSDDPRINDAPVRLNVFDSKLEPEFAPHLSLRTRAGWVHMTVRQMLNDEFPEKGSLTGELCVISPTNREQDEVIALARSWGFRLDTMEEFKQTAPVLAEFIYTIDARIKRAIAKIAFNYLAHKLELLNPNLILTNEFDSARNFVRCGYHPGYEIVRPRKHAILAFDTANLRKTNGHLVAVELIKQGTTWLFLGSVSLFNFLDWDVYLSTTHSGLHYSIHHGHHWDINDRKCQELSGIREDWLLHVW